MGLGTLYTKINKIIPLQAATDRFTIFNIITELDRIDTTSKEIISFPTQTTKYSTNLIADINSLKQLTASYHPEEQRGLISLADLIGVLQVNDILLYLLTKKDEIPFPMTVYMTLAPDSVVPVQIDYWVNEEYDYIRPDVYEFTAQYSIPQFRTNPMVNVVVRFMFTINASSTGVLASHNEIDGVLASYE